MNPRFFSRVCRIAAIGAILLCSASCITVNERLGENFIPTDQKWNVFIPEAVELKDIRLQMSDSLSGYSTTRFTFGSVMDDVMGTCDKATSFTLIPIAESLNFGKNIKVRNFHFTAVRDTVSTVFDHQQNILQNVYVSELKKPLDSTVLYISSLSPDTEKGRENREKYLNLDNRITVGVPVYNGGDSLSFNFDKTWTLDFIERISAAGLSDMKKYLEAAPGIYIETDSQTEPGGRINMFDLTIETDSYGYIGGNYALLDITSDYGTRENVDTSFLFYFGPTELLKSDDTQYPTQFAFNTSNHASGDIYSSEGQLAGTEIRIEGGSGVKPVVKASEIKSIVEKVIADAGITNPAEVVINKATIILPYNVGTDYDVLDKYPMILSPTVCLKSSDGNYVTYAGLTDSSVESENQGNINRSLSMYSPDISHHVQEILKLKQGKGEGVSSSETDAEFGKRVSNYDIWFLIMHEEISKTASTGSSSYDDYYNNLLYNSYYNNMMYDPYGYGYGYGGYGGYGYGGYGYNNYYNYMMMAAYANSSSSSASETTTSIELDKDRYYNCTLNGPDYGGTLEELPRLKITFSAPKTAL
ncbi:MAG: hypothetical protein E7117_05350 [Bacteroidales bacterium]|nr:hypothetical protein [Bacteroidales bacterium]